MYDLIHKREILLNEASPIRDVVSFSLRSDLFKINDFEVEIHPFEDTVEGDNKFVLPITVRETKINRNLIYGLNPHPPGDDIQKFLSIHSRFDTDYDVILEKSWDKSDRIYFPGEELQLVICFQEPDFLKKKMEKFASYLFRYD